VDFDTPRWALRNDRHRQAASPAEQNDGQEADSIDGHAHDDDGSLPDPVAGRDGSGPGIDTVGELEHALAAASPGIVVQIEPGTYLSDGGDRREAATDDTRVARSRCADVRCGAALGGREGRPALISPAITGASRD
jgi:hypothetical protein